MVNGQNETQPTKQPSVQPAAPNLLSFLAPTETPTQNVRPFLRKTSTLNILFLTTTEHYRPPRATWWFTKRKAGGLELAEHYSKFVRFDLWHVSGLSYGNFRVPVIACFGLEL